MEMTNSIVWGHLESIQWDCPGSPTVETSLVEGGFPGGTGILEGDPLFVPGPFGDHYLSQVAAGQPASSPAVDAGSGLATDVGLEARSTRTDSVGDGGTLDLGYHYESIPSLSVLRGTAADALTLHRAVASLPFVDDPGTLSDPSLRLLFYRVPEAQNQLGVEKVLVQDAVGLRFLGAP